MLFGKKPSSVELNCVRKVIKPISAKIGTHEKQKEILENPDVCFEESDGLWDSCSTDLTQFVSVKCSYLQTCSFREMNSILASNCDPFAETFSSISYKCLVSYIISEWICFQFDLSEDDNFSASLIPDSVSYPLFKGKLVIFFKTTIPQQCKNEQSIEISAISSTEETNKLEITLDSLSTIYEADFGHPTSNSYTIIISFERRQLFKRTIAISSGTVITSPPTPFEPSVSVSSSMVTFKWKKLDSKFTSKIGFDCPEIDGIAYYHIGGQMNRNDAKNYCNSLDESLLPTVRSTCRQNKLKSHFEDKSYWIGLTDVERKVVGFDIEQNTYRWDDGSTDYSMIGGVWKPGNPDNTENTENC